MDEGGTEPGPFGLGVIAFETDSGVTGLTEAGDGIQCVWIDAGPPLSLTRSSRSMRLNWKELKLHYPILFTTLLQCRTG